MGRFVWLLALVGACTTELWLLLRPVSSAPLRVPPIPVASCPALRPLAYLATCDCRAQKTAVGLGSSSQGHFSRECVAWARTHRALKQLETWQQECRQGEEASCALLGGMYLEGIPGLVAADVPEGLRLLESVCQKASWKSAEDLEKRRFLCMGLAGSYAKGESPIPKDVHKAVSLYQPFCTNSESGSCSELAQLYQTEPELAADTKQARLYAARACQARMADDQKDKTSNESARGEGDWNEEGHCDWLGKEWLRQQAFSTGVR